EARIEEVPRQALVDVALTRREPVEVDTGAVEGDRGLLGPPVVAEVLAPAVEPAAVAPHALDHLAHAAVTARQQSFDDARLAVVVAEADRASVPLVGLDRFAQQPQSTVGGLVVELGGPLERRVRLRDETADRDGAPDVAATRDLAAGFDDA